jgi:hypothetical protein
VFGEGGFIGTAGEAGDDGVAHVGICAFLRCHAQQCFDGGGFFEFAEGDGGVEADAGGGVGEEGDDGGAGGLDIAECFEDIGDDLCVGFGKKRGQSGGIDFVGAHALAEAPDGVDAGELGGLFVGGDFLQQGVITLFDEGELGAEADALVGVGEVGGGEVVGVEELIGFLALGAVFAGGVVGEPDGAFLIEGVAAVPVGDDEFAGRSHGEADAHEAGVDETLVLHLEGAAIGDDLEGGHLAGGELVEDEVIAQ